MSSFLKKNCLRDRSCPTRPEKSRSPAEFFAVSVEAFFEQPRALLARHPQLYAELRTYFQQDPVEFSAETLSEEEHMSS
jgi:Mlc titration factor MtfA (ptsG expression regulator)